jgi:RNA polymerase sigma-70 factor (ECF subfamily)
MVYWYGRSWNRTGTNQRAEETNRLCLSTNTQIERTRIVIYLKDGDSQRSRDSELTRRSQAGDTEAFGALVTKYRTKIFTVIYGMVRNEHDASDLAQQGFVKAWQSIHRFKGRSSFYTWLYSITMNVTIESLRQKGRREEIELNEAIPSSLPDPRVNCQRSEIREQIHAALAELSPEHREVLVLKELDGLRYHEIAEVLNLSVGTVMSRSFYARKHLQSLLRFSKAKRNALPPLDSYSQQFVLEPLQGSSKGK